MKRITGKGAKALREMINSLSDEELREIKETSLRLTSTNCDWLEYRLRDILYELADNELRLRREKALLT